MPSSAESVTPFQPNSGVVVLPSSTAPCSRRRATAGASSAQGWSRETALEPRRVGQPLVSRMRSEEHTSELQSLMRISYAVFCLNKKRHIDRTNLYVAGRKCTDAHAYCY